MLNRLLVLIALLPLAYLGWCTTHIPGGPDVDAANAVGRYIADGYGRFDDRQVVERTGKGKIYYSSPGSDRHPTIVLYEITTPEDIGTIEALARQALVEFPQVRGASLHFYKKQNLSFSAGGATARGRETPFKKVSVKRESNA